MFGQPCRYERVFAPKHHFGFDGRHSSRVINVKLSFTPRRRAAAFLGGQEAVFPGRPIHRQFLGEDRQRQWRFSSVGVSRDPHRDFALEDAKIVRPDDLQERRILSRWKRIFIRQNRLEANLRSPIDVDRFGKQAPAQWGKAFEQGIHRARFEFAEGGRQPFTATDVVVHAGETVADDVWVRANRVQAERPLPRHFAQALGKEILRARIQLVQFPALPIRQVAIEFVAIEAGFVRFGFV